MTSRLVITNAAAGGADEQVVEAVLAVLREDGPVTVAATADADDLDKALAARAGDPTVVVVGGDGSLHALINALWRRGELGSTRVGLVPLGTGNDFARELGLSLLPEEAARQHVAGRETPIDVLLDTEGRVSVNSVHLGVGASAGREASSWKKWLGRFGYVLGAIKAGLTTPGIHLRITVDGERLPHSHGVIQVVIGNGTSVGGGLELTPDADPGDGWADVMVSYANSPLARLGYALRVRRGEHALREDVVTQQVRHLEVEGDAFWTNADGELSGPYRCLAWRVQPGAATMMIPGLLPNTG